MLGPWRAVALRQRCMSHRSSGNTDGCIEAIAGVDALVIACKESGGCWTVGVSQLAI